jgi:hypothetical protein
MHNRYLRSLRDYLDPLLARKHQRHGLLCVNDLSQAVAAQLGCSPASVDVRVGRYRLGDPFAYSGTNPQQRGVERAAVELPLLFSSLERRGHPPSPELIQALQGVFRITGIGHEFSYPAKTQAVQRMRERYRSVGSHLENCYGDGI